MQDLTFWKWFC